MAKFEFYSVPRIVFGRGQFSRLGELARPLGRRAAVLFNGDETGAGKVRQALAAAGMECSLQRQKGEPTVADVDAAVNAARDAQCDFVIGFGGGSAIDAAKAVAGLLANSGVALDYLEVVGKGQKITQPAIPWIAIPTTAGTGAEATRNAVLGVPEKNFKASLRSELLLPRIAMIDPELGTSVNPQVTASSGMDALCQCIEAYTSSGANPMTDGLALQGIERAARSLLAAYREGNNLDAREDMAMAALLSGIALTNAGLGAVHGFAAPLGASFPIPHGTICAALLAPVMRANVDALRAAGRSVELRRYAEVGRRLAQSGTLGDEAAIEGGIAQARQMTVEMKIPRLGTFGISDQNVAAMVALAQKSSSMKFNPVPLSAEDLEAVLRSAL